ncbi:MAG: penicillin-binding protein 1C [Planctomycetota bacterium]
MARWATRCGACLAAATAIGLAALAILMWAFPFPRERLDRWPASPVVTDRHGRPLVALVGRDDHWRFPIALDDASPWLVAATVAVEDKRFHGHRGVDALAVARAAWQNLVSRRVVSGASTLTMQVCRMMDDRPRTLWAKAVESFRAIELERIMAKDEILCAYLNVAPYGGNVRGAGAAAAFYFSKRARDLSLGEAALLAGLPQSPSRYRPDRNPDAARRRRETVLRAMTEAGMITERQRALASAEPVVAGRPRSRRLATHAAALALARRPGGGRTMIDLDLQREVERLATDHARSLPGGSDVAAVVMEIETGGIVAMVGSADAADPLDGEVNGAVARRSPGSALKPFIYAAAFEAGRLAPEATVHDVPIERGGWRPRNFDRTFSGAVTAAEALRRSLNVPAILVAEGTGLARCAGVMRACGVGLSRGDEERAGLGIAVGTVETTLLDLVNAYATLGRGGVRMRARLFADEPVDEPAGDPADAARALSANTCAAVGDCLSTRRRRPAGMAGLPDRDVPWFMWKTGTSSGRRDAWAVGHNGRFAAGVWVGRFSGEGRREFVGRDAAEPLLARLFSLRMMEGAPDPPPPEGIIVRWPLPRPAEARRALAVVEPADGSRFLVVEGGADERGVERGAVVRLRANRPGPLAWFLDGVLLADGALPGDGALTQDGASRRLVLPPGAHEIRCVDPGGESAAVRVSVR